MRRLLSLLAGLAWLGLVLGLPAQSLLREDENMIAAVRQFYGEPATTRTQAWRQLVREGQAAGWSERERLSRVNIFFNRLHFIDDIKLWGKEDYWATPLEFLGAGGGDCEDFSIAKYFTLLELGIDDSKLRLVYVKALRLNQFHMVVAYYPTPSSVPFILDNLEGTIRPATERRDLEPIYSFNGQHLWLMRERGQGELAGQASRLSLWNDLRGRVDVKRLQRPKINLDR
ncbi:transglutaminase-like cysteine peptidase [Zobellella denitrificans]|jgi:predicted transglutaminase-like cysteine proteinase|uniref:Sulfate adenylyltransferase n=1 Tax=Zobellella denitrificans TaxID=347534 RepID=A0A291HUM5_9GAMM|nr:transglutaminase-like cysteine peptidase [Zobellella denitrificans]ATG75822.1 sulfate adenylyltransferase [Zobellella denitrificans]